ncbi:MAG TPA: SDR family oxidoreductase [Bacteroidales bacterium]|nr:SDR family oxidoreductase [Bacteroidales bacterium]
MNIIITGASKGIGKELSKLMSGSPDNSVLIISRAANALKSIKEDSTNENVSYIANDLNHLVKSPEKLLKMVSGHFSHVDILINNAGYLVRSAFGELSASDEELMINTNFLTPARFMRIVLPLLGRGSHVVNIGSMAGYQGSSKYPGLALYGAAKAGLASLTEALAAEYADEGIKFNCLSIGAVQTEMFETAFPGFKAPLDAEQMAKFVAWFALNGQKYFNGKILPVAVTNPG